MESGDGSIHASCSREQISSVRWWLRLSALLGIAQLLTRTARLRVLSDLICWMTAERRDDIASGFLVFAFLFVLQHVVRVVREWVNFKTGRTVEGEVRERLLSSLQSRGPVYADSKDVGCWNSIFVEHVEALNDFYASYLPQIWVITFSSVATVTLASRISWFSGLILICTLPVIPLFMILIGRKADSLSRSRFSSLERLSGYFLDRLRGLDDLTIFSSPESEIRKINSRLEEYNAGLTKIFEIVFLSSGVLEFFSAISTAMISAYFGFYFLGKVGFGISVDRDVRPSDGTFVVVLISDFFRSLCELGTLYHVRSNAIGASSAIGDVLVEDMIIGRGKRRIPERFADVAVEASDLRLFSPGGRLIAGPLNFFVGVGQQLAVIGENGSGKSSLLKVLMGFLPYTGSLKINGVELSELDRTFWNSHVGWVEQSPILTEKTIRENILVGNRHASEELLLEVVEKSYVSEFVGELPGGLDSTVGEDASNLSAGQVQRISIARALIGLPKLLLLDEPTANLDVVSENLVSKVLYRVSSEQTTLLVTHRHVMAESCDLILSIPDGKVFRGL